jgi:hypothetical protein
VPIRAKGQDVTLTIVANGQVQQVLTDVVSFVALFSLVLLEAEFVGESTARYDESFKGGGFDITFEQYSEGHVVLAAAIVERAREESTLRINVSATVLLNGESVDLSWPDAKFGEAVVQMSGQMDYYKVIYHGESSEVDSA